MPRHLLPYESRASLQLLVSGVVLACCLGCGEGSPPVDGAGGSPSASGGSMSTGGSLSASGGSMSTGGTASGGSLSTGGSLGSGGQGSGGQGSGGEATGGAASSGGASGSGGADGNDAVKSMGCDEARTLQDGDRTLQSGGATRNYKLRVPEDYDSSHPYRLVLGFHGATGNSGQVAPSYFDLWPLAEGSTIFVAPDAVDGLWDGATDVTFVDDILAEVEGDLCIDTARVMLEGFSQGGAMAWTLGCSRPGIFRALVVHSGGGLARPASCEPVAFFSSLGQSESGGAGQTSNSDFFAEQNGCTVESLAQAPSGGHTCSDYSGCAEGSPTRWCDYDGGHTPSPTDQGQGTSWMPSEVWTFLSQF